MGLTVNLDTSGLMKWAETLSARGLRNAIRRAVDKSARAARKQTLPVIADDIGVSKSKIPTPKVQTTKQGDLSARWTVTRMRIGILNVSGAKVARMGGLSASTHRLGGGGSSRLVIARAFKANANGGSFVAYRKGKARYPIKAVYAEHPGTAMGQDHAPARQLWIKTANREVNARLGVEIAKQLVAEGLGPNTPDTGD